MSTSSLTTTTTAADEHGISVVHQRHQNSTAAVRSSGLAVATMKAPNKRVVIGRFGPVTPDQARRIAHRMLGKVADGQ